MLEHWLNPLGKTLFGAYTERDDLSLGCSISPALPAEPHARAVALVGAERNWTNRVRSHLYNFAPEFANCHLSDLGDYRQSNPDFMLSALKEMLDAGVLPVIVGAKGEFFRAICRALPTRDKRNDVMWLTERLPGPSFCEGQMPKTHFLGIQQHINPSAAIAAYREKGHEVIRLGEIQASIEDTEPVSRGADLCLVDPDVMRTSEFPAQRSMSSSGLSTYEVCRILRYAGASDTVRCLVIGARDHLSFEQDISANTCAQLIWYFVSGVNARFDDRPGASDAFIRYTVAVDPCDFELVFLKSKRSGRWWVAIPGNSDSRTLPCAYADYEAARDNRVTERILHYIDASLENIE